MVSEEKRAIKLRWGEVSNIISKEIKQVLGLHIQCQIKVLEGEFWDAIFINDRLPLPKVCQLMQAVHATPESWEDVLPDEGGVDIGDMGMISAEKLIAQYLRIRWEHHLITADSLWLVGVTDRRTTGNCPRAKPRKHRLRFWR